MTTKTTTWFQVMQYADDNHENKRRIYTFDNESSAHDMIEFILRHDTLPTRLGVEEYETTT